jgi:hypothetical protein
MNQLDNMINRSFGFLTVVERAPNDRFGNVWWRCLCRCGGACLKRASQLREGKFFTCGREACRFWSKVYVPEGDSCHEWTGGLKDSGYGQFKTSTGTISAHIYAWEQKHGPVPAGKLLRHTCDVRHCVRDDHLLLGTHLQNMQDMVDRGRSHSPRPPLPVQKRLELLQDKEEGFTALALVEKYGVSLRTVSRIIQEHRKGVDQ